MYGTKEGIEDERMEVKAGGGGGEMEECGDGWMNEGTRTEGSRIRRGWKIERTRKDGVGGSRVRE